jgi:hypothetical protein
MCVTGGEEAALHDIISSDLLYSYQYDNKIILSDT